MSRPRKIRKREHRIANADPTGNREQRRAASKQSRSEQLEKIIIGKLLQDFADPTGVADPRKLGGNIIGGSPREQGTAILDMTDVVLFESMEVSTVDMVRMGELQEQAIFMVMKGRINKTTNQVNVGFVTPPDGAAAIITELLALGDRFGVELLSDITQRLTTLHQGKNVDLHMLKAAIELVLEESDG